MIYANLKEIRTERLKLRKLRREDAIAYYEDLSSSEAVTRYMLFSKHTSPEDGVKSVEKNLSRYETGRNYYWVVADPETEDLMGVISLLRFDEHVSSCSFAYMLGEKFWGRGYGTEAVKAVFDFAFSEMDIKKIEADHMAENPASGAVMRKAGMKRAGTIPGKYEKNGRLHDAVRYEITREEWMRNALSGS